jgi:hypothetical protein
MLLGGLIRRFLVSYFEEVDEIGFICSAFLLCIGASPFCIRQLVD